MAQFHRRRDFAFIDPFRMGFKQRKVFLGMGDRFALQHPPFDEIQMCDEFFMILLYLHQQTLLHQGQGVGP